MRSGRIERKGNDFIHHRGSSGGGPAHATLTKATYATFRDAPFVVNYNTGLIVVHIGVVLSSVCVRASRPHHAYFSPYLFTPSFIFPLVWHSFEVPFERYRKNPTVKVTAIRN